MLLRDLPEARVYLGAIADAAGRIQEWFEHATGLRVTSIELTILETIGDTRGTRLRSPAWYRARIRAARFINCGMHCYVPDWLEEHTSAMERCGG